VLCGSLDLKMQSPSIPCGLLAVQCSAALVEEELKMGSGTVPRSKPSSTFSRGCTASATSSCSHGVAHGCWHGRPCRRLAIWRWLASDSFQCSPHQSPGFGCRRLRRISHVDGDGRSCARCDIATDGVCSRRAGLWVAAAGADEHGRHERFW
jgi:hypothetical protein